MSSEQQTNSPDAAATPRPEDTLLGAPVDVELEKLRQQLDFDEPGAAQQPAAESPSDADPNPKTPAEPAKAEVSAALRGRAEALGMSAAEIAEFGDAASLERHVNHLDRAIGKYALKAMQSGMLNPAAGSQSSAAEEKSAESAVDPAEALQAKVELNEEEVAPELHKAITTLNQHYAKQLSLVQGAVRSLVEHLQQRDQQAAVSKFDAMITALGEDYADELGTGATAALAQDGPAFAKRKEIAQEIASLRAGYIATKRNVPSYEVLFERASQAVLGNKREQLAQKKVATQLRNRQGQFVSRANGHQATTPAASPRESAVGAVAALLRDAGLTDD